jgi:hypothetical protein
MQELLPEDAAKEAIAKVVKVFNRHAATLNYGPRSKASLPLKAEDVISAEEGTQMPAVHCRDLIILYLHNDVKVHDHFTGRKRKLPMETIAGFVGRSLPACNTAQARARRMLEHPQFAKIYAECL